MGVFFVLRCVRNKEGEALIPTEFLHALLVRVVKEEVPLFHSTVDFKGQAQTRVFHQVTVDLIH